MPESRKSAFPSQVHCVVVKWKSFALLRVTPVEYGLCHTVTNSVTLPLSRRQSVTLCHTITLLLYHDLTKSLAPGSLAVPHHHIYHMLHVTPSQGKCATSWQPSSGSGGVSSARLLPAEPPEAWDWFGLEAGARAGAEGPRLGRGCSGPPRPRPRHTSPRRHQNMTSASDLQLLQHVHN